MADDVQDKVKKAVSEAAEMVKGLPEALRGVAFTKAFDALMGTTDMQGAGVRPKRGRTGAGKQGRGGRGTEREGGESVTSQAVTTLLEKLNRTEHPHISDDRKALDLALLVLRAARDESGIEWLTSGEISAVLKKKFSLPVDPPAVRMALKGAVKYVDRKPVGQAYTYRLMAPGEKYLDTRVPEWTDARRKGGGSKGRGEE